MSLFSSFSTGLTACLVAGSTMTKGFLSRLVKLDGGCGCIVCIICVGYMEDGVKMADAG